MWATKSTDQLCASTSPGALRCQMYDAHCISCKVLSRADAEFIAEAPISAEILYVKSGPLVMHG